MLRFLRNALIGAILGGGVAALITEMRPDDEAARDDDPTMVIVRGATFGAVGAVMIGWFRGRRAARRAAAEAGIVGRMHDVIDEVGPRVEDGLERLGEAAGTARERAGAAAGTALHAAGAARDRVEALVS